MPDDEIKEVWVFSAESEKNIVHGQYNPMFYWMAREALNKSFLNTLHVYIHEAAHSEGSHGDPKFDYALQSRIQKIQKFILEHPEEWKKMEEEWNSI